MENNKLLKTIFVNFFIITILLILIEIIFGYWFKKDFFSHHMRGKRLQKIEFNFNEPNFSTKTIFRRDYYGFREEYDFNNKYDLSKIKIVFNGGSTGEETFKPYNNTIVGKLNNYLENDGFPHKIFNASLSGKSSLGKVNDFEIWFNKLKDFNPKVMIFYMGINDRKIPKKRFQDNNANLNFLDKIVYIISQRSFIWEKIKKIKDIYFVENIDGYQILKEEIREKIGKGFVSYDEAVEKFYILNENQRIILKNYNNNLVALKEILKQKKIKPIFITQINYKVNGDEMLYFLNKELKEFCKKNNFKIIKLDEKINEPINDFFWDEVHVNEKGSNYISQKIYPELKMIFSEIF